MGKRKQPLVRMRRWIVLGCLGLFPMFEAVEAIFDANERLYKPFKYVPKRT